MSIGGGKGQAGQFAFRFFDERLVEQGFFEYESGYACAKKLLELEPRPTAVFAGNDHMAMGVLTATREKGLEIPRQRSITGFDDTPFAHLAWPPLTTVRQPISEIAELATETLLKQLQGKTVDPVNHRLAAELVYRESTAEPEHHETNSMELPADFFDE